MKLPCNIVEDMLPMYHDKVCSEESAALVEAHLKECTHCSQTLSYLQAEITISEQPTDDIKPLKKIQTRYKKMRLGWLIAVVCILVLTPLAFLAGSWQGDQNPSFMEYSKAEALASGNEFMQCLVDGDYEKAYSCWDVDGKKYQLLLDGLFTEAELVNFESDGLEKFCEGGRTLEALGGFESFELMEISDPSYANRYGSDSYHISYKVQFAGEEESFDISMTKHGITHISVGDCRVDHPLTHLTLWVQWLVDGYRGQYYDRNLGQWIDGAKAE